jgi:outer membrane protein assembly factor BamB
VCSPGSSERDAAASPADAAGGIADGGVLDASAARPDAGDAGSCGVTCAAGSSCLGGVCQTAASDWQMFGHDSAHSGNNPVELGRPPMVGAWTATIAAAGNALHPVVAEGGTAFVTYEKLPGPGSAPLVAVSLSDGSFLWMVDFGANTIGHPAVVGGTVYVQTTGVSSLSALDAATGAVRWNAPFDSQAFNYWAPTVGGSMVYINGGRYGGMYGFQVADGSQVFFDPHLPQSDSWSPTFFANVLYSFVAGVLEAHDPQTGALLWNNELRGNFADYSTNAAAVLDSRAAYFVSPPVLVAIDTTAEDVAWMASDAYVGTPAVANGVVYAVSGGSLMANDATTGALLWSFAGDMQLSYPPIVANGFVYVSSGASVFAVDLGTHTQAWSAPAGGWLSIASGTLLAAGADGILRAFVLSH